MGNACTTMFTTRAICSGVSFVGRISGPVEADCCQCREMRGGCRLGKFATIGQCFKRGNFHSEGQSSGQDDGKLVVNALTQLMTRTS